MQLGCDLLGLIACAIRRDHERGFFRLPIECHQPVKTQGEWRRPHSGGCLAGALNEDGIKIIHLGNPVEGEVERVVAKKRIRAERLPCACHLGMDFSRRNCCEEQCMRFPGCLLGLFGCDVIRHFMRFSNELR